MTPCGIKKDTLFGPITTLHLYFSSLMAENRFVLFYNLIKHKSESSKRYHKNIVGLGKHVDLVHDGKKRYQKSYCKISSSCFIKNSDLHTALVEYFFKIWILILQILFSKVHHPLVKHSDSLNFIVH